MKLTPSRVLPLVPVVLMIAGVPFFSGDGRIWVLPDLAFWFFVWIVLAPCFLVAADRLRPEQSTDPSAVRGEGRR